MIPQARPSGPNNGVENCQDKVSTIAFKFLIFTLNDDTVLNELSYNKLRTMYKRQEMMVLIWYDK